MIIYKATNLVNGKMYIGLTTQTLDNRIQGHYWQTINNHKNYHFYNAIRKYGWENFKWEVIDDTAKTLDELCEKEIYWIAHYDTYNNGYNSTLGGEGFKGLDRSGEKNSRAILTEDEVLVIIDLLISNEKTLKEISEIFGLKQGVVSKINRGVTWTHLYEHSPLEQGRRKLHADVNGERNAKAQLTDEQVYEIKHKLTHGATRQEIMDEYDISYQLLQRIIRGIHWANVKYEGFHVKAETDALEVREAEVRMIKNLMADGMTNHEIKAHFNDKYTTTFLSELRTNKIWKNVVIDRPIGETYLKLQDADVKEIKKLLYQGMKHQEIADKFGVERASITQINKGKTWTHITIDTSQLVKDELKKPRKASGRKLTEDNVREIKKLLKMGISHSKIAEQFGIARAGVSKINTGKRFPHITIEDDDKST